MTSPIKSERFLTHTENEIPPLVRQHSEEQSRHDVRDSCVILVHRRSLRFELAVVRQTISMGKQFIFRSREPHQLKSAGYFLLIGRRRIPLQNHPKNLLGPLLSPLFRYLEKCLIEIGDYRCPFVTICGELRAKSFVDLFWKFQPHEQELRCTIKEHRARQTSGLDGRMLDGNREPIGCDAPPLWGGRVYRIRAFKEKLQFPVASIRDRLVLAWLVSTHGSRNPEQLALYSVAQNKLSPPCFLPQSDVEQPA